MTNLFFHLCYTSHMSCFNCSCANCYYRYNPSSFEEELSWLIQCAFGAGQENQSRKKGSKEAEEESWASAMKAKAALLKLWEEAHQ